MWRLRGNGAVEGVIYETMDEDYKDGEAIVFMNTTLQHYPFAAGFWPDHFILSTQTGKHFFLHHKDQLP